MSTSCSSFDRLLGVLNHEPIDHAPNFDIIMAYGVRYIGAKLQDYYLDYKTLVQMNLAVIDGLQLDLAQCISDPYREAYDLGLEVNFPEDGLPMRVRPLIENLEDLSRLQKRISTFAPGQRMTDRLEAIRALKEQVGDRMPVMGWVEGALAEANDLRGDSAMMTDFYDRPAWLTELLETLVEVEISFARAQIEAGADIIGLGDAIASTISPAMYRKFALPYEQRIFAAVKAMGAIPRLHICGNTNRIVAAMADSGAAIIDLDWMVDFGKAAEEFQKHPNQPALCGNFDPVRVMLQGTAQEVYQATWANLRAGGSKCISAAGCEIPIGTPVENFYAQNKAIQDFGSH